MTFVMLVEHTKSRNSFIDAAVRSDSRVVVFGSNEVKLPSCAAMRLADEGPVIVICRKPIDTAHEIGEIAPTLRVGLSLGCVEPPHFVLTTEERARLRRKVL